MPNFKADAWGDKLSKFKHSPVLVARDQGLQAAGGLVMLRRPLQIIRSTSDLGIELTLGVSACRLQNLVSCRCCC